MIDPASAIGLGSGVGAIIGTLLRFLRHRADHALELKKAEYDAFAKISEQSSSHIQKMEESVKIDKGEPFKLKLGRWFYYEGTHRDRVHPPRFNSQLWMLTATYCGAVAVCFLCADVVILERPANGDPNIFELFYGIVRTTTGGARVYIQTLGGLGSALLTTASVILTATFVGIYDRRK